MPAPKHRTIPGLTPLNAREWLYNRGMVEELYRVSEVAEHLGVSVRTVKRWQALRAFPKGRKLVGKEKWLSVDAIAHWLAATQPRAEILESA